jgi:hypothetical protein
MRIAAYRHCRDVLFANSELHNDESKWLHEKDDVEESEYHSFHEKTDEAMQ